MLNARPYNPSDWFWLADDGRVFSSARGVIVTASDAGYLAFGKATVWPRDLTGAQTDAALQEVLPNLVVGSPTTTQLIAYAQAKAAKIEGGGVTVNIGSSSAPLNVECATDQASVQRLQMAAMAAQANPSATQAYPFPSGVVTLTAAQVQTIFGAVTTLFGATLAALSNVVASITASPPTITTLSQIDAAAWPANS